MLVYIVLNDYLTDNLDIECWLKLHNHKVVNAKKVAESCDALSIENTHRVLYSVIGVCDCIFVPKNWRQSAIARAQLSYAKSLKKHIIFEEHYKDFNPKRGRRSDKVGKDIERQDTGLPCDEQFECDGVCENVQFDSTDDLRD